MQTERPHPKELSTDGEWWEKVTKRPGKRPVAGLGGGGGGGKDWLQINNLLFVHPRSKQGQLEEL